MWTRCFQEQNESILITRLILSVYPTFEINTNQVREQMLVCKIFYLLT